jgi:hypothetical protein
VKKITLMTLALFGLAVFGSAMAGEGNSRTSKESVYWFSDGSDTGGESRLTRTGNMILLLLEAEQLTPGDAHTIWFVVFNKPENCVTVLARDDDGNPTEWVTDGICDDDDFLPAALVAAEVAVGNATGNVAKEDGTAEFGGRLVRNVNLPGHQILFPAGFTGASLLTTKPKKAEVHLIVQTHGQAFPLPGLLDQLTYVADPGGLENCNPNPTGCEDIQFAVHKALGD